MKLEFPMFKLIVGRGSYEKNIIRPIYQWTLQPIECKSNSMSKLRKIPSAFLSAVSLLTRDVEAIDRFQFGG